MRNRVIVGAKAQLGRMVITDPAERARINPPLSAEAMAEIARLERAERHGRERLKTFRFS